MKYEDMKTPRLKQKTQNTLQAKDFQIQGTFSKYLVYLSNMDLLFSPMYLKIRNFADRKSNHFNNIPDLDWLTVTIVLLNNVMSTISIL